MDPRKFVIASNNTHKVNEIRAMMPPGYKLLTLNDAGISQELPETTGTFEGNALQKAEEVYRLCGYDVIADDSGLIAEALHDKPGVDTAFYGGEPRSDERNMSRLLNELAGLSDRKAWFICVLAVIMNGERKTFEGRLNGTIAGKPSGTNGFGYDPVFIPEGYSKTLAQLGPDEKNRISHRAIALRKLHDYLKKKES